jgi:hypothetical protein
MPAVVAGDPDCGYVLLNGCANDIPDVSVKTQVNYLNPVSDKFEVDGVDRAVVSIADRNSG